MAPQLINAGNNTDSFITGYSRTGRTRPVRHLRIDDDSSFTKIYQFGNVIGRGNFGTVYEVRDMKDNKTWASKVVVKRNVTSANMRALEREMSILKVLDHPHIIMLREILESQTKFYLILEKCQTDLFRLVQQHKVFSEAEVKRVINDLAGAVTYLHKNDIVHRDIKLENILVTDNPKDSKDHLYIKLSDFGLSIIKSGRGISNMLHERCGTLMYMAPEILTSGSYSQQCDVWASGVIMYYLLTKTMPFDGKLERDVVQRICNEEPNFDRLEVPVEAKDLLKRLLNKDPAERMTAAEMTMHPWLRNKKLVDTTQSHNVIDLMRLCNKDMRISAEDAPDDELFVTTQEVKSRPKAAVTVQNVRFSKNKRHVSGVNQNALHRANNSSTMGPQQQQQHSRLHSRTRTEETSRTVTAGTSNANVGNAATKHSNRTR